MYGWSMLRVRDKVRGLREILVKVNVGFFGCSRSGLLKVGVREVEWKGFLRYRGLG